MQAKCLLQFSTWPSLVLKLLEASVASSLYCRAFPELFASGYSCLLSVTILWGEKNVGTPSSPSCWYHCQKIFCLKNLFPDCQSPVPRVRNFNVDTLHWQQVKTWTTRKIKLFLNPWKSRDTGQNGCPETGETDQPTQDVSAYQSRNLHVGTTAEAGNLNCVWCIAGGSVRTSLKVKNSGVSVIDEHPTILIYSRSST